MSVLLIFLAILSFAGMLKYANKIITYIDYDDDNGDFIRTVALFIFAIIFIVLAVYFNK